MKNAVATEVTAKKFAPAYLRANAARVSRAARAMFSPRSNRDAEAMVGKVIRDLKSGTVPDFDRAILYLDHAHRRLVRAKKAIFS